MQKFGTIIGGLIVYAVFIGYGPVFIPVTESITTRIMIGLLFGVPFGLFVWAVICFRRWHKDFHARMLKGGFSS